MGNKCNGVATDQPHIRETRAYCEGRAAAAAGVTATLAAGTTGVEANNNGITWTAKVAGNGIAIFLVDPGAISQALAVSVSGQTITVSLATDGGGDISSTAAAVINAVAANAAANALVGAANTGASTGLGIVTADQVGLTGYPYHGTARDSALWASGFDTWTADPAGFPARDCCAHAPGGGFVLAQTGQPTEGGEGECAPSGGRRRTRTSAVADLYRGG